MTKALKIVHVCGIPGSGKTAYCEWLKREKGFLHMDFDRLLKGDGNSKQLSLIQKLNRSVEDFISEVFRRAKSTVIDWGFPIENLPLVMQFKKKGIAVWWFDGDREAARESFALRGTVSMEAFDRQIQSIERNWFQIKKIIGKNIIETVTTGPVFITPKQIYRTMFPSKSA